MALSPQVDGGSVTVDAPTWTADTSRALHPSSAIKGSKASSGRHGEGATTPWSPAGWWLPQQQSPSPKNSQEEGWSRLCHTDLLSSGPRRHPSQRGDAQTAAEPSLYKYNNLKDSCIMETFPTYKVSASSWRFEWDKNELRPVDGAVRREVFSTWLRLEREQSGHRVFDLFSSKVAAQADNWNQNMLERFIKRRFLKERKLKKILAKLNAGRFRCKRCMNSSFIDHSSLQTSARTFGSS